MPMTQEDNHAEIGPLAREMLQQLEQSAMQTKLVQDNQSISDAEAAERFAWFSTACMMMISKTDDIAIVSRVVGFFNDVLDFSKTKRVELWKQIHDLGEATRKAASQ